MKFEYKQSATRAYAKAEGDNFVMRYVRMSDKKHFMFAGKAPSRRLLREMVKKCEQL